MDIKTIKVMRVSKKEGATNKGGKTFAWIKYGFQDDKGAWYGCFSQEYKAICDFNNVDKIQEGMEIKAIVTEKEFNGRTNLDLSAPDKADMANEEIANITTTLAYHSDRITRLEAMIEKLSKTPITNKPVNTVSTVKVVTPSVQEKVEEVIDIDDLPF